MVRRQRITAEARALLAQRGSFSAGGARDVRESVRKAALDGMLEPAELLDVRATLEASDYVRSFITRLEGRAPLLAELAGPIEPLPSIVREIGASIDERAAVLDGASPALAAVRRELRVAHDTLLGRMNEMMRSAVAQGVAQEPLVTQRDGRYVIPVKADLRGRLRGVVHDVSQSGATVFIEPLAVVELGNRWRELQIEEQREIERALRRISADVGSEARAIAANVEALGQVDLALAKARLGEALDAAELPLEGAGQPWLTRAPAELRMVEARHPLLAADAVPITLAVGGDEARALLITGPNTGGKTVALKTAGLLACMAQAGLPVPAAAGSRFPVFGSIAADIGDEQSIEQSLSTFSGHIGNIVDILREANDTSLVLLDELAAGTDPAEGAPLARAVLETLLERRCVVIATTHHGELKAFAHETPGVMNASVEFDPETLAPTYRLVIGLPGSSNAFAIARRLGMPGEIVRRALLGAAPEQMRLQGLLTEAQRERDRLSDERRAEMVARREAEEIRRQLSDRLRALEGERDQTLETARTEIEADVREARLALRRARRDIERGRRETLERSAEALGRAESAAERIERRRVASHRGRPGPVGEIGPGDRVWLAGISQPGEALSAPDQRDELEVLLGALRTRVSRGQVERVERGVGSAKGRSGLPPAPTDVADEIEVRGRTLDEAMPEVEALLDRAFRAGLPRLRIVHGKGTGTLRRAVRDLLAAHPLVSSFETAPPAEGGEGVTVAYFGSPG